MNRQCVVALFVDGDGGEKPRWLAVVDQYALASGHAVENGVIANAVRSEEGFQSRPQLLLARCEQHYGILRRQGSEEFLHSRQKFISLRPQMSVVNDQRAIHIENPRFGKRRQA